MRTFIVIAILSIPCLSMTAQAAFVPVLPGPCERVVAAKDHIAVLRKGEVFILREDGSVLGHVAKTNEEKNPQHAPSVKQETEQLLDLLEVEEIDRDTDYADDLLDNERRLAQRQRVHRSPAQTPAPSESSPTLAASASEVWIADTRGLLRVGSDGALIRAFGRDDAGTLLAVAGQRMLISNAGGLALLSIPTGPRRAIPLSSGAQKVALSASGRRQAWATPSGVSWANDLAKPETFVPASAVADLTYCEETLVVLLADSVVAIPPDGRPEVRARNLHARRLICPDVEGTPWLAVGQKFMASPDQGRQWESLGAPAGVALVDVAASPHHLWLATSDGLYASADGHAPTPTPTPRAVARQVQVAHPRAGWLSWMPKVSVRAVVDFAPGSHRLEALASAAFPIDGRTLPVTRAAFVEDSGEETGNPTALPHRSGHAIDLRDPDERCLAVARRKSVELAMSEPERAASYVTRAGRAAWLPELRVLVSRRYGRSESLDVNSSSTALSSPLGIDTVNDIRYEARATWDLGKLVFSSEELAAQTQALHMAELRRDIETTVNRLYFERRGLVLELSDGRGNDVHRHLRTSEIEADLDAMSAGAFGTCTSGK
jgi:hypothetical protein